tara:strand:- start:10424 stop:10891 length:468 start_codon:yes stop_codon:yes gene_type:complete
MEEVFESKVEPIADPEPIEEPLPKLIEEHEPEPEPEPVKKKKPRKPMSAERKAKLREQLARGRATARKNKLKKLNEQKIIDARKLIASVDPPKEVKKQIKKEVVKPVPRPEPKPEPKPEPEPEPIQVNRQPAPVPVAPKPELGYYTTIRSRRRRW